MTPTLHSASSQPVRRPARTRARPALAREQARLHAHFRAVLTELRARDVSDLAPPQRAARRRLVAELARYARAARFPRNLACPDRRTPIFIDAAGTRCAMAHLIESTGHRALVARVAAAHNLAYIRELASDADLRTWLRAHGLTAAEAARIQPEYCFITRGDECLCQSAGLTGLVEATVQAPAADGGLEVTIEALHGDALGAMVGQSIVAQGQAEPGDLILAQPIDQPPNGLVFYLERVVAADGTISCGADAPPIAKDVAIPALLASPEQCLDKLTAVDDRFGESICGDDDHAGCGCKADTGAPLVGTALLVATLLVRRRRRRPHT